MAAPMAPMMDAGQEFVLVELKERLWATVKEQTTEI